MVLKGFAKRLLEFHAEQTADLVYGASLLSSIYSDADLRKLDEIYGQLAAARYLEDSGEFLSLFGNPKTLYVITEAGRRALGTEAAV